MGPVDDSEQLIALVLEHEDIANYADGCAEETIVATERELGCRCRPRTGGWWRSSARGTSPGRSSWRVPDGGDGDRLLGSVRETLDARADGLPEELVVTMFDGMGGLVVLEASTPDSHGECPVLVWQPPGRDRADLERLGKDFGSYALDLVRRSVEAWRARN